MPSRALILLPVSFVIAYMSVILFNAYVIKQSGDFEVDGLRLLFRLGLCSFLIYGLLTRDFWAWWFGVGFGAFVVLGSGYLLYLLLTGSSDPVFAVFPPLVVLGTGLTMSGVIVTLLLPGVRQQFRRSGGGAAQRGGHRVRTGGHRY